MDAVHVQSVQSQSDSELDVRWNWKRKPRTDDSLKELILRYALLVTIAIVSTFVEHAIAIRYPWIAKALSSVDDAVNVWCLILIHKANHTLYRRLCAPCIWAMQLRCCRN